MLSKLPVISIAKVLVKYISVSSVCRVDESLGFGFCVPKFDEIKFLRQTAADVSATSIDYSKLVTLVNHQY